MLRVFDVRTQLKNDNGTDFYHHHGVHNNNSEILIDGDGRRSYGLTTKDLFGVIMIRGIHSTGQRKTAGVSFLPKRNIVFYIQPTCTSKVI